MSLFTTLFTSHTVRPNQRLLEYVDGRCTRVLEPGRHRAVRRATYVVVSLQERVDSTAPQEVLTADGASVRVTVALRWAVSDPQTYVEVASDPAGLVYLAVQVTLRDALVDVAVDDVARVARRDLGVRLTEAARVAGAEVGIAVRAAVVKDVILPHELREATAALITARTRGQAQLEAARAETAALRSLANGAKLLEDHPALARLRLVQALPMGSTVELTTSD